MSAISPLITLNNVKMPALGLGVYQRTPEQTVGAVETAAYLNRAAGVGRHPE